MKINICSIIFNIPPYSQNVKIDTQRILVIALQTINTFNDKTSSICNFQQCNKQDTQSPCRFAYQQTSVLQEFPSLP